MTSCSIKRDLNKIQSENIEFSNVFNLFPMTAGNNGIYYLDEESGALYFYNEEIKVNTKLMGTHYIDDKPSSDFQSNFRQYRETMSNHEIMYYDDELFAIFIKESIDGSFSYSLKRLNKKGENLETLIDFDDFPLRFKIDSGKVYVLFGDTNLYIKVYNSKFKLTETLEFDGTKNPYGFYFKNGELIIPETAFVIETDENIKIAYNVINAPSGADSSVEKTKVNSSITINGKLHTFEGKLVMYASDNYFYVTNLEGTQIYEKYDFNGKLVSSVKPEDSLITDTDVSTLFWSSDYSLLLRVTNEKYAYGHSNKAGTMSLFLCDFDTSECRYLND